MNTSIYLYRNSLLHYLYPLSYFDSPNKFYSKGNYWSDLFSFLVSIVENMHVSPVIKSQLSDGLV